MAKRKSKAAEEPVPAPAEPEAPAPPPAPVPIAPTRIIELSPDDSKWFVWHKREVQTRPEPKPFDFAKCREQLAKLKKHNYGGLLANLYVDSNLTRQEAHYWFLAVTAEEKPTPAELADTIAEKDVTGKVGLAEAIERIQNAKTFNTYIGVRVALNLFDAPDIVKLAQHERFLPGHTDVAPIVNDFARVVLPYLTEAELNKTRAALRPDIDPAKWPRQQYERPSAAFFLAALVGMPDELLPVVRAIPDDFYSSGKGYLHYHQPQRIVFGLDTPQLVESEMRRLKLPLRTPEYARAWLAATQFSGLDYLAEQIRSDSDSRDSRDLVREFARVQAPEAAPYVLEMKLTTRDYYPRQWLENNTANAIFGLLAATTGRGKVADGAVEYLREAKRRGHEAVIRAALAQASPEVAESVRKHVLDYAEKTYPELAAKAIPKELKTALDAAAKEKANEEDAKKAAEAAKKKKPTKPKPPRIPVWAEPSALPPILLDEHKLNDEHITLVLDALSRSTLEKPDPLVVALKKTMDANALDNFAWKLFHRWNDEDYPPNEKWTLIAIGLLGGDSSALKITPLIRAWPGESAHKRAVFGLECLRTIGSDTALMQLNGISQKLKFKALKQKAAEAMEAIAKQKGLSRTELEDRVVPNCDLDERGQRIFDFGARQFRFVLAPDMKPMVKDADGKVKPDLPKPGQKDDATKAGEAVAAWKLMKKQIKEVAKSQSMRLEQAMVTGRRWPVADFNTLLVKHPLMINLVRLLLWGGFNNKGALASTFRVTEDQTFADPKDATYTPKDVASVGVVHPLLLSEEQKSAWGEVFSDYEIVPPFAQLGRSVFRLEEKEKSATEIARFNGVSISAATLVYGLEARGWIRIGGGYGNFSQHYKHFASSGVTAFVEYDGVSGYGYINPEENTSLGSCYFSSGIKEYSAKTDKLKLSEVDPVAVSEVINEISTLTAKAK